MKKIIIVLFILSFSAAYSEIININEKEFIMLMIKNSYDAQAVKYDYLSSQLNARVDNALYNPEVFINLGYNSTTNAPSGLLNSLDATSLGMGVSKLFSTGTVASLEIGGEQSTSLLAFDFETSQPNVEKKSYDPYVKVNLIQPLLKGGIPWLPGKIVLDLNNNNQQISSLGSRLALESMVLGGLLQYHQFLTDFAILKINQDSLNDFRVLYAKYQRQYSYGSINLSDLLRFQSQVNELELSVRRAKARLEHDLETIEIALKTNINLNELNIIDSFLADVVTNEPETAYATALSNGAESLQTELLFRNANLFYKNTKNDALPHLDLSMGYTVNGNYSGMADDAWSQAFNNMKYNEFFIGLEFRMPFLAPSERAKVFQAEYNKKKAWNEYQASHDQMYIKIKEKIREIEFGRFAIAKYNELVKVNQKIVSAARKDYSNGEITSRDLVSANEDFRRIKTTFALEILAYKINVLELELMKGNLLNIYDIELEPMMK